MIYRRIATQVTALQFDGNNVQECIDFIRADLGYTEPTKDNYAIVIFSIDGNMRVAPTDWILKEKSGLYYRRSNEEFLANYELAT